LKYHSIEDDFFEWQYFNKSDGLTSNKIYAIQEDSEKNIWFSTSLGVNKYYPDKNKWENYYVEKEQGLNYFSEGCGTRLSTGEIIFGDGKLGGIPAHDAEIIATSYRYVSGGSQGNVPADSITLLKSPILGIKSVINPQSASGGSDWEDIEDTKRRAPQQIKSRYRAVTKEDYEFLAKESTNEVAKVRCLGPKKKVGGGYMDDPIDRNPGKVNLIIVPQIYYNPADDNTRKPMPPDDLINEIKTFLEPRCMLTSELILNKPIYVEIGVEEAVVYIRPGEDKKKMEEKIKNDLIQFFHPVSGSYASKGWEIGEDVYLPQVFDTINRHSEISYIEKLAVKRIDKPSANGVRIEIEEYELVCAAKSKDFKIKIKVEEQDIT